MSILGELETKMFNLKFVSNAISEDKANAEITLGDFHEQLYVPIGYWKKEDYIQQWIFSLKQLLGNSASKAALVVEMYNPASANYIKTWALYREGKDVYVQNIVIFLDNVAQAFNVDTLNNYVPDRETHSEDGEKISEWHLTIQDIDNWLMEQQSENLKHS